MHQIPEPPSFEKQYPNDDFDSFVKAAAVHEALFGGSDPFLTKVAEGGEKTLIENWHKLPSGGLLHSAASLVGAEVYMYNANIQANAQLIVQPNSSITRNKFERLDGRII